MSETSLDSVQLYIDHIVVAAPDLAQAKAEFAQWTGTELADGGPHPGAGTCNALASFRTEGSLASGAYLEVIAPDRAQALAGTNGERFTRLAQPTLLHWAVRSSNLQAMAETAKAAGFVPGPIRDMARVTPDGEHLRWQLMGLLGVASDANNGHRLGGLAPFFIDWQGSPHPADSAPVVGGLNRLSLPNVSGLGALIANVQGGEPGAADSGMSVEFSSSKGDRGWHEIAPRGFGF